MFQHDVAFFTSGTIEYNYKSFKYFIWTVAAIFSKTQFSVVRTIQKCIKLQTGIVPKMFLNRLCVIVNYSNFIKRFISNLLFIFQIKYNKTYDSYLEEYLRSQIFFKNLKMVEENNKKYAANEVNFKMEINKFSDMYESEGKK